MRSTTLSKAMAAVFGLAILAACSGSDSGGSGGTGNGAATGDGIESYGDPNAPAELEFWAWATDIDKVVEIWNDRHPDQQVTVNSQAQGDELVTRLLTAHKAGNAPCLMQAEYQALPVLVTNGVATDITAAATVVRDEFPESAWELTSFGGQSFAIPQDVAAMMLYYRHDIFAELDLEVPTTWQEFADVAAEIRQEDRDRYLTTFSANDPGWFAGLSQQAGANWWSYDGERWTVSVNDQATSKVASYWGDLVDSGVVDDQPMYTPQWNRALSDGTLLAWPSAVWGAAVLEGVAPSTKGKWAAAPMPQWTKGENVTGYWGGSATAVSENCEHKAVALKFATWLNSDPEALEALVSISGVYPAATAGQSAPALDEPPSMMPDQADFYDLASQAARSARGWVWGPNVNVTYSAYGDAFGAVIQSGGEFTSALGVMQRRTVADMTDQGFPVTGN